MNRAIGNFWLLDWRRQRRMLGWTLAAELLLLGLRPVLVRLGGTELLFGVMWGAPPALALFWADAAGRDTRSGRLPALWELPVSPLAVFGSRYLLFGLCYLSCCGVLAAGIGGMSRPGSDRWLWAGLGGVLFTAGFCGAMVRGSVGNLVASLVLLPLIGGVAVLLRLCAAAADCPGGVFGWWIGTLLLISVLFLIGGAWLWCRRVRFSRSVWQPVTAVTAVTAVLVLLAVGGYEAERWYHRHAAQKLLAQWQALPGRYDGEPGPRFPALRQWESEVRRAVAERRPERGAVRPADSPELARLVAALPSPPAEAPSRRWLTGRDWLIYLRVLAPRLAGLLRAGDWPEAETQLAANRRLAGFLRQGIALETTPADPVGELAAGDGRMIVRYWPNRPDELARLTAERRWLEALPLFQPVAEYDMNREVPLRDVLMRHIGELDRLREQIGVRRLLNRMARSRTTAELRACYPEVLRFPV